MTPLYVKYDQGGLLVRTVKGYQLKLQKILHLTKEECEHLIAKMGVFAVSIKSLFDDPIIYEKDSITAHYTREDYARDTLKHVQHYLQTIKMENRVIVTLVDMTLSLDWDDTPEKE